MTVKELIKIINDIVNDDFELDETSTLVGGKSMIDSMNLVQICIALEERSQKDGFEFDWTSEKAMSELNSIFRTPETLTKEYNRQMSEQAE